MKQLDPKSVWLFFFSFIFRIFILMFWFAFLLVGMILRSSSPSWVDVLLWILISLAVSALTSYFWAKLTYKFYKYEVTEDGFRKEHGIIWKKYVTIPYDRIQNVDIYRGPLARILGLSDLNIQTAGASATVGRWGMQGAGAEGRLPGLSQATAEELRDELVKRARNTTRQGL